jgi:hypothetical protein
MAKYFVELHLRFLIYEFIKRERREARADAA